MIHELDGVDQMNPECPFRGRCIMTHQDGTPCQLNHSKHSTKYYPARVNCRNHSAIINSKDFVHMFFNEIDYDGDGANNDGAAAAYCLDVSDYSDRRLLELMAIMRKAVDQHLHKGVHPIGICSCLFDIMVVDECWIFIEKL